MEERLNISIGGYVTPDVAGGQLDARLRLDDTLSAFARGRIDNSGYRELLGGLELRL